MTMNTSLYFTNLTEEEIRQILNVVSVPYLMEPLKKNPDKYLKGKKNIQSLSREAVNHIYLQFLSNQDMVLSLFLSDVVVDIIHYFKLSDDFKNLLIKDDPTFTDRLKEKIEKRGCPITIDMFLRLLDKHAKQSKEAKFFDVKEETPEKKEDDLLVQLKEANDLLSQENENLKEQMDIYHQEKAAYLKEAERYKQQLTSLEEVKKQNEAFQKETEHYKQQISDLQIASKHVQDEGEEKMKDLNYQVLNLQIENQNLKDENRELLFHVEDDSEVDGLKRDMKQLQVALRLLQEENEQNKNELAQVENYKEKYNQALLDLREERIKHISLQAEMDQLRYAMKNDSKKLKELQNRGRNLHDEQGDWMMAMHDLTWYKKQWNIPGDEPLHKLWAHLNNEEGKTLAKLLKDQTKMLRTERRRQMDILHEILIVKNAILILLRQEKDIKMD